MEKYLKTEYGVFEDKNYLTKESQIETYFKDNGRDWLDCGIGYAEDKAEIICKIGENFYNVVIKAEIGSSILEYGDDLCFVEYIDSVTYEKIDKPLPKEKKKANYELLLTEEQKKLLESYMKELYIEF